MSISALEACLTVPRVGPSRRGASSLLSEKACPPELIARTVVGAPATGVRPKPPTHHSAARVGQTHAMCAADLEA
jgi:hypothetical protein